MRKYHPCQQDRTDSFRNDCGVFGEPMRCGKNFPIFDLPCLYAPQYPYPCACPTPEKNSASMFFLSGSGQNETFLTLEPSLEIGHEIHLDPCGTMLALAPGNLYQISYNLRGFVSESFGVTPMVDGEPDPDGTTHLTKDGPVSSETVSANFFIPVLHRPSHIQFRLDTTEEKPAEFLKGSLTVISVSQIR